MDSENLPLTLPLDRIEDFFNCPVCMSEIKNTFITPCGHRYCEGCIKECVGRHHKCPCCNHPLNEAQLIKDPTYDDLINTVVVEKEKSETQYFDTLINTAACSSGESGSACMETSTGTESQEFSPVERVLRKHMKQALASHEKYYQELKRQCQRRKDQVDMEFRRKKEDMLSKSFSQAEWDSQLADCEDQKKRLDEEMAKCAQLVADAYDRYLTEHIPSLAVLPVRVTLNILQKNITIPEVEIKPQHTIEDIRLMFETQMKARGDEIVKYGNDAAFLCFGAFCKQSRYEKNQLSCDIVEHGATHPDIFLLPAGCHPLLQFALKPGSEIALYGRIQCESDMPKQCFACTFKAGESYSVDYFSCRDCSFNWVCRSCMEVCHKDHNVIPYIMNHHPTWACCYCPKKKKCVIQG